MPRKSRSENVRKICGCVKWKQCTHPWYLDYQRDNVRFRDNLDLLIDRHAADFTDAKDEAQRAIRAKLDGRDPRGLLPTDDVTLAQVLEAYDKERPRVDRWQVGRILATPVPAPGGLRPFGAWRASAITTETLKQFRHLRPRVAGNRDLNLLRAAFNWAVLGGLLPRSPFRIGDVPAIKMTREHARTRRLQPGEHERLLLAAGRLKDLITGALETGCRKGELLSLQWHQVRFAPRCEIFLPAEKTKGKRDRRVPISSILRDLLTARQIDPAGVRFPPDAYVFGDEIGRQRTFIKRTWEVVVLRAHEYKPTYIRHVEDGPETGRRRRSGAKLTAECRTWLREINLHFHDLRREAGSRWMDAGVPLATIQRWLGHANIAQTSTYLGASLGGDERDMSAYEARIGRVDPLTQIDVFDSLKGQEAPRSDSVTSEKIEQISIVH
jgi:integrase